MNKIATKILTGKWPMGNHHYFVRRVDGKNRFHNHCCDCGATVLATTDDVPHLQKRKLCKIVPRHCLTCRPPPRSSLCEQRNRDKLWNSNAMVCKNGLASHPFTRVAACTEMPRSGAVVSLNEITNSTYKLRTEMPRHQGLRVPYASRLHGFWCMLVKQCVKSVVGRCNVIAWFLLRYE